MGKFLHGRQWIMFHGAMKFASGSPRRGRPNTNSDKPCQLHVKNNLWMRVTSPHNYNVTALGSCCEVALSIVRNALEQKLNKKYRWKPIHITLLKSITVLCGTDCIPHNTPHMQTERGRYYVESCQSCRLNGKNILHNYVSPVS
jgi:hypothetical protein